MNSHIQDMANQISDEWFDEYGSRKTEPVLKFDQEASLTLTKGEFKIEIPWKESHDIFGYEESDQLDKEFSKMEAMIYIKDKMYVSTDSDAIDMYTIWRSILESNQEIYTLAELIYLLEWTEET